MKLRNNEAHYGLATRVLHWCVALLIVVLIALGWWMVELSYYDRWYHDATLWHKSLGMIALLLGTVKIIWVAGSRRVEFADGVRTWERAAARSTHWALLILAVLIPLSGYAISTSAGDGVSVFGWFEIPALFAKNTTLRDGAILVHWWASYCTAGLVLLHAGAAMKHQFIDRNGTLRRMLW